MGFLAPPIAALPAIAKIGTAVKAIGTIATAAGAVKGLMGGGKPSMPSLPQAPSAPPAPQIQASEEQAAEATRKRKAYLATKGQTIYTNPLGVANEATIARKSLLGE